MSAAEAALRAQESLDTPAEAVLEMVLESLAGAMACQVGVCLDCSVALDEMGLEPLDRGAFLKQHARPSSCVRLALVAPGVAPLEFLVVLGERDVMRASHVLSARSVASAADGPAVLAGSLVDAIAVGLKRGLEARLGFSWHVQAQEREDARQPDAVMVGSMARVLSCGFHVGDASLAVRVLFPEETATRLVLLERDVPVVKRPRLAEIQVPRVDPGPPDMELLREIPVTVEAVLDTAPLTVGEVACLREGMGLGLAVPWTHGVRLVCGGQVLARGELVMVGDKRGVLLHAIGDGPA